jgi:hypothetical protein
VNKTKVWKGRDKLAKVGPSHRLTLTYLKKLKSVLFEFKMSEKRKSLENHWSFLEEELEKFQKIVADLECIG